MQYITKVNHIFVPLKILVMYTDPFNKLHFCGDCFFNKNVDSKKFCLLYSESSKVFHFYPWKKISGQYLGDPQSGFTPHLILPVRMYANDVIECEIVCSLCGVKTSEESYDEDSITYAIHDYEMLYVSEIKWEAMYKKRLIVERS